MNLTDAQVQKAAALGYTFLRVKKKKGAVCNDQSEYFILFSVCR